MLPRLLKDVSQLGWPERQGKAPYFTKVVHLGRGMGMEWYARATLFDQEILRAKLKLEAGDALLYDNARMLHARTGFQGARWVRGVYFDR
jgi:hypothetical protein